MSQKDCPDKKMMSELSKLVVDLWFGLTPLNHVALFLGVSQWSSDWSIVQMPKTLGSVQ